jgi:dihydroorotate dehydrogenase electron transfer subunit
MKHGTGELTELYLENGLRGGRLLCAQNLIPAPGQYLLAHDGSDAPLPVPVFSAGPVPGGFLLAPAIPQTWQPGASLSLRGPLGRGFSLPAAARNIALVSLGETSARLKPLLTAALGQGASIVLVSDLDLAELPPEVEVQPLAALVEIAKWADYLAIDVPREFLLGLREMLGFSKQARVRFEAQVLVVTPMPCGGLAECGVCAVTTRRGWKMACKDGPVFDLRELI